MNREKALVKNTIILTIGTFLPKLVGMITLPILTGYLTTSEFGFYDLIITLISLLLPAVTLQIQSAAFRFLIKCRNDINEARLIISNIFYFTIPISLVAVMIMAICIRNIDIGTKCLIICYFLTDIILVTLRQITRGLGDNIGYSIDSITNSIVMLLFVAVSLLWLKLGLLGILLALTLSSIWSVCFLSLKLKIWHYLSTNEISFAVIKELLAYSWPMVPNNLSGWVLSLSDRVVITGFLGIEANAIYAAANKIPNILKAFQSTFTFAWQENASLSADDADKETYYSKMFAEIARLLTSALSLLMAVTPMLFRLLIRGNSYEKAFFQIPILYLAAFFSVISAVIGGIYIAHMRTKSVGITTMLAAGINLAVDLLFVRLIGIYAGSLSTLVSYLFLTVYRMIDVKRFQPMNFNLKEFGLCIGTLALMSFIMFQKSVVMNRINILIAIAFTFIYNKKIIVAIVKNYKKK